MTTLPRRSFLKTSFAASVTAAATATSLLGKDATQSAGREFYELRAYHLHDEKRLRSGDADPAALHAYLEHAFIPAAKVRGATRVGVFSELEVDKKAVTAAPKPLTPVWVLIAYPSLDAYVAVTTELNNDTAVQAAGADYLNAPKSAPAFARIDSWLLRAFASMPRIELPAFCRDRVPSRVIELRDYESHSELKALNKMAMFDVGETQLMRDLGMHPLFFGEALSGPNLPHLRYITCGPDLATHLAAWGKFGPSEGWIKLKNDPQWADNTSLNTARFLAPTAYSEV